MMVVFYCPALNFIPKFIPKLLTKISSKNPLTIADRLGYDRFIERLHNGKGVRLYIRGIEGGVEVKICCDRLLYSHLLRVG